MNVPDASVNQAVPNAPRYEEAVSLMEQAMVIIDELGLCDAASHLEHAICLVPDAFGTVPRPRSLTDALRQFDQPA
jgi:hypothetical protein